ncbi:hypothetical protein ACFXTN_040231 [Malus domestica]
MGWELPPSGGPPVWVSFAKQGFYGFKLTVCALCCSNTHEILQCPDRKYFSNYVKEHINMRNGSLRHWDDPTFDYYAPDSFRWASTQQPFDQPSVPQDSKEWFVIQTPQCATSYDYMQEDARIEKSPGDDSSTMEEITDPEIPPEPIATQFCVPPAPFP